MQSELEKATAFLHDVVEDTGVTIDEIEQQFGQVVAGAVSAMTRKEGEDYADFIKRLSINKIARKVKIADLTDNLDLSRLQSVSKVDMERA